MRRLPIYILIDCSVLMRGKLIESLFYAIPLPHFQPNFLNKTTSVAQMIPSSTNLITSLFTFLIRLVMRENHLLLRLFRKKN
jgi:hypothetical protein